jgi:hypothetical protein
MLLYRRRKLLGIVDISLCFKEAFERRRKGDLSEEDYFEQLLAHFRGIRHPEDSDDRSFESRLLKLNPYAKAIWNSALREDSPITESAELNSLFLGCLEGNMDQMLRFYNKILVKHPNLPVRHALATLASEKGHADILEFFLRNGVLIDTTLDRAMELGFYKSPDMLRVLSDFKRRDIHIAKDSPAKVDEIVHPNWSNRQDEPPINDRQKETLEERHKRLIKEVNRPIGTCKTSKELEERFDWIDW